MEQAMTLVWFPRARRQTIISIAALSDRPYQERVWLRRELPFPDYYDELDLNIHVLFDDLCILPHPGPADHQVLLPGPEVGRLAALGTVFDSMIRRLGDLGDADYLSDPQWPEIVDLAQRCLPALILAGGWDWTDSDTEIAANDRAEGRVPTVELPATRRRVITAVAALADDEYQRRTWPSDHSAPDTGSLAGCLRTLDETGVLPDPAAAVGRVLLPGDETDRLATLGRALQPLHDNPPPEPWHHPNWHDVTHTARTCLPALIIAGAWIGPDPNSPSTGATERP